jgi:hypothetical protein
MDGPACINDISEVILAGEKSKSHSSPPCVSELTFLNSIQYFFSSGEEILPVYASGDVIPLIEPELEKAVRRILNYPDIGEVSNGTGP